MFTVVATVYGHSGLNVPQHVMVARNIDQEHMIVVNQMTSKPLYAVQLESIQSGLTGLLVLFVINSRMNL